MKDNEIDYQNILELDDAFFKNAKVVVPHHKDSVTLRYDHDVLK